MKCEVTWVAEDGKEFDNKLHCAIYESFQTNIKPLVEILFDPGEGKDANHEVFTQNDIMQILHKNVEGSLASFIQYDRMKAKSMCD